MVKRKDDQRGTTRGETEAEACVPSGLPTGFDGTSRPSFTTLRIASNTSGEGRCPRIFFVESRSFMLATSSTSSGSKDDTAGLERKRDSSALISASSSVTVSYTIQHRCIRQHCSALATPLVAYARTLYSARGWWCYVSRRIPVPL